MTLRRYIAEVGEFDGRYRGMKEGEDDGYGNSYVLHSDVAHLLRSHEALRAALRAILDDHDERVRIFKTWEEQAARVKVMEAGRAALTEAAALEPQKENGNG
jgi:hypothetical protein